MCREFHNSVNKCSCIVFKDHYGDAVIKRCLGKIEEINEFSAFDKMRNALN